MENVYALLFGAVQGLTEFLPVSSSGHLVILHHIFNFQIQSELGFDVFLHLGSLVALILFFYKDIWKYLRAWVGSLKKWDLKNQVDQKLAWLIVLGTIPAAVLGYFLDDLIEENFRSTLLVVFMLVIVAILFLVVEKLAKKIKDMSALNWKGSLAIGLAQALALIPGVSRSGATIITGMGWGLKRGQAARFSFLLSIPIVLAAGVKKTLDLVSAGLVESELAIYVLGFVAAAVVGYLCIKYFLRFLEKYSLKIFAYYRLFLAGVLLILLLTKVI